MPNKINCIQTNLPVKYAETWISMCNVGLNLVFQRFFEEIFFNEGAMNFWNFSVFRQIFGSEKRNFKKRLIRWRKRFVVWNLWQDGFQVPAHSSNASGNPVWNFSSQICNLIISTSRVNLRKIQRHGYSQQRALCCASCLEMYVPLSFWLDAR